MVGQPRSRAQQRPSTVLREQRPCLLREEPHAIDSVHYSHSITRIDRILFQKQNGPDKQMPGPFRGLAGTSRLSTDDVNLVRPAEEKKDGCEAVSPTALTK